MKTLNNHTFSKNIFDSLGSSLLNGTDNNMDECTTYCLQQSNKEQRYQDASTQFVHVNTCGNSEEVEKNVLIEQATNRLRQKVLESKLKSFISSLVEIQSQLEIIKLEASVSLKLLPTSSDTIMSEIQLEHFEKRFVNHTTGLKLLIPQKHDTIDSLITATPPTSISEPNPSGILCSHSHTSPSSIISSSTYSATPPIVFDEQAKKQSIISSLLSAYTDYKNKGKMESDYSILGEYDHQKRVLKRKRHYQYQHEFQNYNISPALLSSATSSTSPISRSLLNNQNHELPIKDQILPSKDTPSSDQSSRNAFDDVLSYIDHNADDIEFANDLSQLLASPLFTQTSSPSHGCKQSLFKQVLSTGIKYVKLTIVMLLAITINIKRGHTSFHKNYFHNVDRRCYPFHCP